MALTEVAFKDLMIEEAPTAVMENRYLTPQL